MNVRTTIQAALPQELFEAALAAANAWRGRCLNLFARNESAVTETLLVLASLQGSKPTVRLPHLVGQRYDALALAFAHNGPFEEEGNSAVQSLSEVRLLDPLRTHLSHGVFKVTLDQKGVWHMTSRLLALRGGKELHDTYAIDEAGAGETLSHLEQVSGRLRSNLGQVRKRAGI